MRIPLVTRAVRRTHPAFMLQWHKARNKRASVLSLSGNGGYARSLPHGLALFLQIGDAASRNTWEKDGENRPVRISACFDGVLCRRRARLSEPPKAISRVCIRFKSDPRNKKLPGRSAVDGSIAGFFLICRCLPSVTLHCQRSHFLFNDLQRSCASRYDRLLNPRWHMTGT